MGFDDDFGMAVAKSQIAASNSLPTKGMAFLSVKDSHKQEIIGVAQRLIKLGFTLSATKGTSEILKQNGMKEFFEILASMNRFDFIEFGVEDIVRSGFVKEYIIAKEYT